MAKVTASKTTNPLHFEDLEPHRFEDLVRQLAYDFRNWIRIEATGRLGGDDGIDIHGIERREGEGDSPEGDAAELPDRVWVFQCKREKRLGPADVKKIVADALPAGGDAPHAFVLAAACDFSKKTREAFHAETAARGVRESLMWGKADLEDLLFLPVNDHLLFAYFNISLQVRRRSLKTSVRSRLAMKKRVIDIFGGLRQDLEGDRKIHNPVLIRDPREDRYPNEAEMSDFSEYPRWRYYEFFAHGPPDSLAFVVCKHLAYVDDARKLWDAMFGHAIYAKPSRLSRSMLDGNGDWKKEQIPYVKWHELTPEKNRAYLLVLGYIHIDQIIAIDTIGDLTHDPPHVFVEFDKVRGPFGAPGRWLIEHGDHPMRQRFRASAESRVAFYPSEIEATNAGSALGESAEQRGNVRA